MMEMLRAIAHEGNRVRRIVALAVGVSVALSLNAFVGGAQERDDDRVEGVVEAVRAPSTILVRTRERLVSVDLAALGGVTVAVTAGTKIVAVGMMESGGEVLHAKHIETPTSP